jgi:hypothetical protein
MKNRDYIIIFLIGWIVFLIVLLKERKQPELNQKQNVVDSLIIEAMATEAAYIHVLDSLQNENNILKRANNRIKKSTTQILQTNEQTKIFFFTATDSVKLLVIDSMLRSNRYR